jgi:hypothetical protein
LSAWDSSDFLIAVSNPQTAFTFTHPPSTFGLPTILNSVVFDTGLKLSKDFQHLKNFFCSFFETLFVFGAMLPNYAFLLQSYSPAYTNLETGLNQSCFL